LAKKQNKAERKKGKKEKKDNISRRNHTPPLYDVSMRVDRCGVMHLQRKKI
jgi:hypothetical protein